MYLNSIAHYLPSIVIDNDYFLDKNGLTDEWIFTRTGIKTRRKAEPDENANTMAIEATKRVIELNEYPIEEVDLIIGGTYTPYDTVGTMAHVVQEEFAVSDVRTVSISSACSSLINAIEIVEGYFATGKAEKALVIVSEHNTGYSVDTDEFAGHLWGDGSAALFVSKDRVSENDLEFLEITTQGLANVGKGTTGVGLQPLNNGIKMRYGKDVFIHACNYMTQITKDILKSNDFSINDLDMLIPHQANVRILNNVVEQLGIEPTRVISNVERLGNTGCVSTAIGLSENLDKLKKGMLVCLTVFGGGYSSGAALLRV
ncbi:MAG: 3-oxoacyl-ACP synthase [Bacteroidetes bacterium 4572_117]|nr:MAG: 3-oxoacyl-ACP synthase [Bacteroidetes bacterium 4572_117]